MQVLTHDRHIPLTMNVLKTVLQGVSRVAPVARSCKGPLPAEDRVGELVLAKRPDFANELSELAKVWCL